MPGVNVPGSPQGIEKTAIPIAGSIIGGIYGGPAGAAAGGKIGSDLVKGGPDPGAIETKAGAGGTALDRRIQAQEDTPSMQLAQADAALAQLPPEYAQQYGATIAAARKMDSQGGTY